MFPKLRVYDIKHSKFIIPCEGPYDDIDVTYADGCWYITGGHKMTQSRYRIDLYSGFNYPIGGKELYENDDVIVQGHYEGSTYIKSFIGVIYLVDGKWMVVGDTQSVSLLDYVNNYYRK